MNSDQRLLRLAVDFDRPEMAPMLIEQRERAIRDFEMRAGQFESSLLHPLGYKWKTQEPLKREPDRFIFDGRLLVAATTAVERRLQ